MSRALVFGAWRSTYDRRGPLFLRVHKLFWPAWSLAHVVFGFIGNKIAWQYHDAESKAEVKELERWWNIGGLIALLPTAFIIAKMLAKAGR